MFLFLIIIAAILFAYLAWKNLFQASLVMIACLPLYVVRFSIGPVPSTLLEIFVLILFFVWLLKKPRLSVRQPFYRELILWLAIGLAAATISGISFSTLGIWRAYFFEPALAFIVFISVFNSKEKVLKAFVALAYSAIAISLIAMYQYITGDLIPNPFWANAAERRATSIFPYPNAVGLYLAPIVILSFNAAWASLKNNKKYFYLFSAATLIGFIGIYCAKSDGALFAVAIAGFISCLFINKYTRIAALTAVIAVAVAMTQTPIRNYIVDRATLHDFSGEIRRLQWRETWKMLRDGRLVTGAGLLGFKEAVKPYHQEGFFYNSDRLNQNDFLKRVWNDESYRKSHWQPLEIYLYPHNIVWNFWSELGILGLLLFIFIIVRYYYSGIAHYLKTRDPILLGLLAAMLAILIHGIVDVPYFKNDLAVMFWLLVALVSIL